MKRYLAIAAYFLLTLSVMSIPASAQKIDRTKRPEAAPLPDITFPAYESFTLKNGLKVFLVQDPRPSVTMRLMIGGGEAADGEIPSLAETAATLLTKGAGDLSAQEFAEEIDFLGGSINTGVSPDAISVSASGLQNHIEQITALFAKAVLDPSYEEDEVEKYVALTIDGLKASRKEADFLAEYAVKSALYGPDSPLGAMPTEELLEEISDDKLREFHSRYFIPSNASIAVIGNLNRKQTEALLNKHFGTWSDNGKSAPKFEHKLMLNGNQIILVDRPTSVQSAIRIIGPGPGSTSEDRARTYLMNSILGGGTGLGNRLAMNLRETHGWTYSPYSYFTSNRYAGNFVAAADVRNEVTDSAIIEMIREVERMGSEPVETDELDLNIKSAVGSYLMSLANPSATAGRVQSIDFYGMPRDYYDRLVDVYMTSTAEDMMQMAKRYFRRDEMTIVVVGKASEVREDLEKFGTVQVWDENLKPVQSVSAEDIGMTAEEIWDKMLDAMGGRDDLKKIKSLTVEGEASLAVQGMNLTGTFDRISVYPRKEYASLTLKLPQGTMKVFEQFVDGKNMVMFAQGQRVPLPEEEVAKQLAGTHILSEAWLHDLKGSVTFSGVREVEGVKAYVIEMTLPGAESDLFYIDQKTFLPVRREAGETAQVFEDWKEIDGGIRQPGVFRLQQPGADILVSNVSYKVNATIDDKIFVAP